MKQKTDNRREKTTFSMVNKVIPTMKKKES